MTGGHGNTSEAAAHLRPAGRRRRERRCGFTQLLASLMPALRQPGEAAAIQIGFERAVERLLAAHSAHLYGVADRWPAPAGPGTPETVRVAVPTAGNEPPAQLEIRFGAAREPDAWDTQTLGLLAHVAALVAEIRRLRQRAPASLTLEPANRRDAAAPLIGASRTMCGLRYRIERVAATDFTVLIEGESGVGKELVARQIHDVSRRRRGPFIAVNCAALVETLLEAELFGIEDRTATGVRGRRGKFEHADGGTLFLDEIADLSLSAQAKLLRVLQELAVERVGGQGTRPVDVRIVAATNASLKDLVDRGLFRHDLFYRLGGIELRVPPLRMRREDILELARYFLERHRATRAMTLSPGAADALVAYSWPGNVRELQRVIEGAVALAESAEIALDDLPPALRGDAAEILLPSLARGDSLRAWAARYVRLTLERCGGNRRRACRVLDISYHTLRAYLREESVTVWADGDADARDAADAAPHA